MLLVAYLLISALVFWRFRARKRRRVTGYVLAIAAISFGIPVFAITFGNLGIPLFGVLAAFAIVWEPRSQRRRGWYSDGGGEGVVESRRAARIRRRYRSGTTT